MRARIHELPAVSVGETLAFAPGIVDLWWRECDPGLDAEILPGETLMTPDERTRGAGYRFERERRLFFATRVLVRTVLSQYAPVAPADWRFAAGTHGKPRIGSPVVAPPIYFNLTNAPGLVACAVSVAHELLGVDAEETNRAIEPLAIAARYFAASESQELQALPADKRLSRFIAHWTLKESYVKARGLGLSLALDQFQFRIGDAVTIAFGTPEAGDAHRWRSALIEAPRHTLAVSVDTGGADLSLRAKHVVPRPGEHYAPPN